VINTIILLITIAVAAYLFYRQYTTNKQLHNEITTNSEAVEELESNTYHSQSDIESMIEDGISNLQYDVDDHGTSISNLQDDTVNQDEIDELKEWITRGEDKIIVMVKEINERLDEILPAASYAFDEEPKEQELIEQNTIDEVLSVTVRTGKYTKRDNGDFKLREQNEKTIKLSGKVQENVMQSLRYHSDLDEFPSFLENIYKGDKDEMGPKAPAKKTASKI
tara:strand:- start:1927 stop:2592 length:666 start_codon:yes stop_codon:yes gene_type:complete